MSKESLRFCDDELYDVPFKLRYKDNGSVLVPDVDVKYKLLYTDPPYILDTVNLTLNKTNVDFKTLDKIQKMPIFKKEFIKKVYETISLNKQEIILKKDKSFQTEILDIKPIPYLVVFDKIIELYFLYANEKIDFYPIKKELVYYKNNKQYIIKRDIDFEAQAKDHIQTLGFEAHKRQNTIYFQTPAAITKQEKLSIWKQFLDTHTKQLQNCGYKIDFDDSFDMKFESNAQVVVENTVNNHWFNLSFNLNFNGKVQPIAPLVAGILEEFSSVENMPDQINIEVEKNHFVLIDTKIIKPIIQTIFELMDKKELDNSIKVSPYDAHLLANLDEEIIWEGSKDILKLSQQLKTFQGIQQVPLPRCFESILRGYQQDGLNWLNFLHQFKFGGILADDMGLGKTVQTLVHLSKLKEDGLLDTPSLIIMPTSLIANWKNEIKKFTPNLSVLSLHGNDRYKNFDLIEKYDILLTTYPLITRDKDLFLQYKFYYIILDEAQKIKNPKAKMTVAIKTLKSKYKLALSGTPIENHLGELWSIFSFLMPGFLDTNKFFKSYYQIPIEKENNFERQKLLNKKIKPFMLRRTKELVASELPQKSIIVKYTQFDSDQSKLYESIRVTMEEKVRELVKQKGIGSSHITILDALLKLRQVCCAPSRLNLEESKKIKQSAKLELLLDLLDELLQEKRKILLFSQFTSMLSIVEDNLKRLNINYTILTGSTRNREQAINKFTSGEVDIFLISLKAGGVGLNLVEADTVIHYDPWWNPAVENLFYKPYL
jgi:SNF2 family DNA or RNA helicase